MKIVDKVVSGLSSIVVRHWKNSMKYTLLLFFILLHSAFAFAHVKFSEAERTIIRLQDERRGIDRLSVGCGTRALWILFHSCPKAACQ